MKRRSYRPAGAGTARGVHRGNTTALRNAWWLQFTGRAPERTETPLKPTHATRDRQGAR